MKAKSATLGMLQDAPRCPRRPQDAPGRSGMLWDALGCSGMLWDLEKNNNAISYGPCGAINQSTNQATKLNCYDITIVTLIT